MYFMKLATHPAVRQRVFSTATRIQNPSNGSQLMIRHFGSRGSGFGGRATQFTRSDAAPRRSIKETLMQPTTGAPFMWGRSAVAAGAALGMGALCFYGAGFGSEAGAIDRAIVWPEYVRQRIRDTYFYFGSSLALTASAAAAVFRSPAIMNIVARSTWPVMIGSIVAMIASGMIARSIPYSPGLGTKQLAWAAHAAIVGTVIAPICILGGPLLLRAAMYTAGMVGGLSAVAMCAPSEKFLMTAGPLSAGLGIVIMASLGSAFVAPTTALGAGLVSISLYGGLLLFGGFILYDTQKIIQKAEMHPTHYAVAPFDPVNASIGIYLDTINIFIRIATILAGGGGKKR